jgi:hypothetical protein
MTRVTLVVSIAVWLVAVVVAWRSADHVIPANRLWTRAWRIVVATVFAANLGGIWFPFGAAYIATRYFPTRPSSPDPTPDPA